MVIRDKLLEIIKSAIECQIYDDYLIITMDNLNLLHVMFGLKRNNLFKVLGFNYIIIIRQNYYFNIYDSDISLVCMYKINSGWEKKMVINTTKHDYVINFTIDYIKNNHEKLKLRDVFV